MGSEDVTLQARDATQPEVSGSSGPERLERFGRFVVLERVGSGGAGSVHRAYDPQLDRSVAIKVLHCETTVRLLGEARAMAKLRHPNVVAVYDVGEENDRVWVAMEYVEGGTLRQWLAGAERSEAEIIEVFRRAGAGLAAAHQQGLVHRDFKPDNVLMHASGRPAVTDFGLAYSEDQISTSAEGAPKPEDTVTSRLAGTPAYMSPEQFRGAPVGPASDQFSFGVALFEALCRRRPFPGESVTEISRRVVGEAFEFPSDVSLRPWLRAVLERMLARDPDARFPSMDAALRALDRDPGSRRHRLLALGTLTAVSLGSIAMFNRDSGPACDAGAAVAARVWDASRREALEAALAVADAGPATRSMPRVYAALDAWTASWVEAYDGACESTHVRGMQSQARLDDRARCLEGQLDHVASLTEELEHADADVLHKALDVAENLPKPGVCDDPSQVEPTAAEREAARWHARARVRNDLGRFVSGMEAVEQGLAVLGDAASPERVWLLTTRGQLAWRSGDNAKAEASLQDAIRAAADASNPEGEAQAWIELVMLVGEMLGDTKRADGMLLAAEAAVRVLDDPRLERRLEMITGMVAIRGGRLEEGVAAIEHALEMGTIGDSERVVILGNYGNALYEAGRYEDALEAYDEVLALNQRMRPEGHPSLVEDHHNRSRALQRLGRDEESAEVLREAVEAGKRAYGPQSSRLGAFHLNLGVALLHLQRYEEAASQVERAIEVWTGTYPEDHRYFRIAETNLGIIAAEQGDYETALEHYRSAKARAVRGEGPKSKAVSSVLGNEANALLELGKFEECVAVYREALELSEASVGPEHPDLGYPLVGLARALIALESFDEATEVAQRARRLRQGKVGPAEMYLTYITLAEALAHRGQREEAMQWADAASTSLRETGLPSEQAKELHAFRRRFGRH